MFFFKCNKNENIDKSKDSINNKNIDNKIKFTHIFSNNLPTKITGFDKYNLIYYGFLDRFIFSYKINFDKKKDKLIDIDNNISVRFNLTQLFNLFMFKLEDLQMKNQKDRTAIDHFVEIFHNYNFCVFNKIKIEIYNLKEEILVNILQKIERSAKFEKNYNDSRLRSSLNQTRSNINESKINYIIFLNLYKHLSNKEEPQYLILLDLNLEQVLLETFKNSLYIKYLQSKINVNRFENMNFSFNIDYSSLNNILNISLNIKKSNKNNIDSTNLEIEKYIESTLINYELLINDINSYKESLSIFLKILNKNIEIFQMVLNKYHFSHDRFISILENIFRQIDEILDNIEKIIEKQEKLISIFNPRYFKLINVNHLDINILNEYLLKIKNI